MPTATLSSKGQITLPKEVRDRLGAVQGDVLELTFNPDGSVRLRPLRGSVRSLAGLLHRPEQPPVSVEDMDASILDTCASDDERVRKGG